MPTTRTDDRGRQQHVSARRRQRLATGDAHRRRRRRAATPGRSRRRAARRATRVSRPVLVTHGHPDHASGAPAIASAHPAATFAKLPWPAKMSRYARRVAAARRRRPRRRRRRDADRAAHARTLAGSPRVLARAEPHRLHRRSRRARRQRDDPLEPRRQPRAVPRRRSSGCWRSSRRGCCRRTGREIDDPRALLHRRISRTAACAKRRCSQRCAAGHETVQAIAESIYDGLDPALLPAARENVRAHLEKLKAEGHAQMDDGQLVDGNSRLTGVTERSAWTRSSTSSTSTATATSRS